MSEIDVGPKATSRRPMGAPRCRLKPCFVVSVDLAWMRDYTAVLVGELLPIFVGGEWIYEYHIVGSEMTNKSMDPKDSYAAVAQRVYDRVLTPDLQKKSFLAFDMTGCGSSVAQIFWSHKDRPKWLPVWPIVSTDGARATGAGTHINVPKIAMVGSLQVVLESRRLHIWPDIEHVEAMKNQLKGYIFRVKKGHLSMGSKTEELHDDFVTAFMQMTWIGEHILAKMEPSGNVKLTWG